MNIPETNTSSVGAAEGCEWMCLTHCFAAFGSPYRSRIPVREFE
ncbi:Uncharacterised protein [Paucimonas lemoignei]|nr:Uncharacterised protein [Paucimonas lemoignei]